MNITNLGKGYSMQTARDGSVSIIRYGHSLLDLDATQGQKMRDQCARLGQPEDGLRLWWLDMIDDHGHTQSGWAWASMRELETAMHTLCARNGIDPGGIVDAIAYPAPQERPDNMAPVPVGDDPLRVILVGSG